MIVAVASGKGGTGKTTVALNLAVTLASSGVEGRKVRVVDCDVEEPNVHLFLTLEDLREEDVEVDVPAIDRTRCDGCGECSRFCHFNAIVTAGPTAMVFPEMCHSCGGCALVCPRGAIRYVPRRIGVIASGNARGLDVLQGRLDIGVAMAPPLIRALRHRAGSEGIVILDSPPGTSCPVINTIRGADRIVLVTEPTPFGLNDLKLAVEVVRELGIRFGVVLNRADSGDSRVDEYCAEAGIPLILRIPDSRQVAEAYSRGTLMIDAIGQTRELFDELVAWLGIDSGDGEVRQ